MENDAANATETAIFAGGCFWCMEPVFDKMPGVLSVMPGYTGGTTPNPSYREVCTGETGHVEAVQIVFEPARVSYRELLKVFWRNIDPTTKNRQFCDYGSQYRTAVFCLDEEQRRVAEASREEAQRENLLGAAVVTEILPASDSIRPRSSIGSITRRNPTTTSATTTAAAVIGD